MSQLDSLREAVRVSPDNVPLLVLFAETCLAELSVDEAVETFQKALAKEPSHVEARVGLARALHQAGRTSEAILRLEAFVEEEPEHAAAWLQLSRFLMAEGQRDAAVAQEKLGNVFIARGDLEQGVSRYRNSLAGFERLYDIDHSNVVAMRSLGISNEKLGDTLAQARRPSEAIPLLHRARDLYIEALMIDPSNMQLKEDRDRVTRLIAAIR